MVLLMEIKLKVQLNTARRQERSEIIILDFLCLLTEIKECTEIINNLPKVSILTKGRRYNPLESKLTGKRKYPKALMISFSTGEKGAV